MIALAASLLSLALVAGDPPYACEPGRVDCVAREGIAEPVETSPLRPEEYGVIRFGEGYSFYIGPDTRVYHASDPEVPLDFRAAYGHRVRACIVHWTDTREILDGMSRRDFALALAAAALKDRWRAAMPDVLVYRGLASDLYHTRRAAHACLVRRGESAIPVCVLGLRSRDAEVRLRCRLILESVRTGFPSDD